MPLSIALTADPELPVPPRLYGGIERIVDVLAKGLTERGHNVTVFAHRDSITAGRLAPWPGLNSRSAKDTLRNAAFLAGETARSAFDVVHSFSRIAYLTPILPLRVPKLMTYQRAVTRRTVRFGHMLSRGTLEFTAISRWMMGHVGNIGRWSLVPNGVPLETYSFKPAVTSGAPLVFLGRVEEIKGPHLAIEVARRTGLPLIIAGNIPPEKQAWFDIHIAPNIDGSMIRFIGPVDDSTKNNLLREARALLMPILWDEPFGIVMAEALACGTPVLGFNRGAVPEVIENAVTGFVCRDIDELTASVGRIGELNRAKCRESVELRFCSDAVVDGYLAAYRAHASMSGNKKMSAI